MPEPSTEACKRLVYDGSISGAQDRPYIPHLRSDAPSYHPLPRSLADFRAQEGREYRKARLRALWKQLLVALESDAIDDAHSNVAAYPVGSSTALTLESARQMRRTYERELMGRCKSTGHIEWKEFKKYAEDKEAGQYTPEYISLTTRGLIDGCNEELWNIFHNELDLDSNGHLDADELTVALRKAGERILLLVCGLFSVRCRRGTSISVDAI